MAKKKIFIATRDKRLLALVEKNFNDCEIFSTAEKGLLLKALLIKVNPDFIFLDVFMPDMDGIETLLILRQWVQTPITLLTTWRAGEGKIRGLGNLGDLLRGDYLGEPFSICKLKEDFNHRLQEAPA